MVKPTNKRASFLTSSFLLGSFLGGLMASESALAQYYKTLPKGVRLGVYRNVKSQVDSSFNRASSESPFSYELKADVKFLESIENDTVQTALDLLRPYPEAYSKLNLGEYKIKAKADVNVDGYGFAYGITNKITAYMALPIFKANVSIDYRRSQSNNYEEVAGSLQNTTGDDFAQAIGNFVDEYSSQLDVDDSFLQNLVVNGFGYDEVGDWEGQGLGDVELGVMYNFLTTRKYGLLLSAGTVAPTGRVDDPDIIQDIGFGDGQWDLFAEFGGSYHLTNSMVLSSYIRYTHQLSSDKTLRVPYSSDVNLGDETNRYNEKLGDKVLLHFSNEYYVNDWLRVKADYEYEKIAQAKYSSYDSEYSYSNDYLATNTDASTHTGRITGEISSVGLYQAKKFILPGAVKFIYQTTLDGTNTAKVDRYELELRMYF
jgi:hypothetical protein